MRPVNLIPPEDRRGEQAPTRTGPLAYLVVGALLLVLAGVAVMVLTSNQISDRKTEVANLEIQLAATTARAQRLASYTQFHAVRDARSATVASLAESRFDWDRVVRELSLILPNDVWLTNLTATSSPTVTVDNGAGVAGRDAIAGPALELLGCAPGQEAVAGFVSVLHDIDGVTRVGVSKSELPASSIAAPTAGAPGASGECQTRNFIAKFEIVVAFDAAPVPSVAAPDATVVPVAPTATTTSVGG